MSTLMTLISAAILLASDSLTWQKGPSLETGRDHHATFVTARGGKARLWVVGGNDYRRVFGDVWSAEIRRDGSVSEWQRSNSLPFPRAGHAVAADDRTVIIAGGQDSTLRKTTEVWTAQIGNDGRLGAWTLGTPLPAPRFHHAMLLHDGWLYLVGGLEARESVAKVHRARIGRDGKIGSWESLSDLPRPRSHHAMVVHDGALYLLGGLDGNPAGTNTPLDDVLRAEINRDGTLGEWREVSRFPHAYATHASAVFGGALWLFGGVEDNARFVNVVLRAPLAHDGTVGTWTTVEPGLPAARSHVHQVPVHDGRAYSVGGSNRRVVTGDVYFAPLGR
ncbi:MAG TPA: hypothetical protein VJ672_14940 [Gemmatimonadaceae bacterium]|nr:hypothetical protein [Gemmatimonadaceae bacterium]